MLVVATKAESNFQSIAFFNINNPGIDNVTVAVINASAVPNGTPFPVNASTIGSTLTELAYRGKPKIVASGTPHQSAADKLFSTNSLGINPWINAPIPTPKTTYGKISLVICRASCRQIAIFGPTALCRRHFL